MSETISQNEDPTAFLHWPRRRYSYRPLLGRAIFWLGILCLLSLPLLANNAFASHSGSNYEKIKTVLVFITALYSTWTGFVISRQFKELTIGDDGIKILPYGLHFAPQDVEDIRFSQNFAGARTIEVRLTAPHWIFYPIAWSLGRKVTIAVAPTIVTRLELSAK